MTKEYWYFLGGVLLVLIPLGLLLILTRFNLWEARPDKIVVYKTVDQQKLKLHAFIAKSQLAESPALLLFHGGRWLYGGPHGFYPQCQYFAEKGISCFSVEYRLGSQGRPKVREAMQDAKAALDYLRAHADELGIDPQKIAVGGGSSGGHLAAMLGVQGPASERPTALVLYCPMLDMSPGKPDHHLVADYWQEVSPLHAIDANTPSTLILVGTEDLEVPLFTVADFCGRVQEMGGRCEAVEFDGQGHGFFNYKDGRNPLFEEANQKVTEFLKQAWSINQRSL